MIQEWTFESSSGGGTYRTRLENGVLSCTCRGWTTKRPGQERSCKHTKSVQKSLAGQPAVEEVPPAPKTSAEVMADEFARHFNQQIANAPQQIEPMLAHQLDVKGGLEVLRGYMNGQWVQEEKYNGNRVTFAVVDGTAHAWSRPRAKVGGGKNPGLARVLPPQVAAQARLLPNGYYDAELDAMGESVLRNDNRERQRLVVFDILELKGQSVIHLAQQDRRQLLEAAYRIAEQDTPYLVLSEQREVDERWIVEIWERDGEGIMLKKKDALYQPGYRTHNWLKVKPTKWVEATITGYLPGKTGPLARLVMKDDFGVEVKASADKLRDPALIGRRVLVEYTFKTPGGSYLHPRVERLLP